MGSIETCTHYENNVSCTGTTTGLVQLPLTTSTAEGASPFYGGGFEGDHHHHHHHRNGVVVPHETKKGGGLITNSSTSSTTTDLNPSAIFELGNSEDHPVPDFIKGGFDQYWACSSGSILSFGTSTHGERSGSVLLGNMSQYGSNSAYSKNIMISEEEEEEDQEDDQYYSGWAADDHVKDHDKLYQWNSSSNNVIHLMNSSKFGAMEYCRVTEKANNCLETASTGNYGMITTLMKNGKKENQSMSEAAERIEWLYSGDTTTSTTADNFPKSGGILSHDEVNHHPKRPYSVGDEIQATKKLHCAGASTRSKPKLAKPVASKDPQSIAAKNRRERISERLKILQDLVPNGTKVDLVTMLEKAISYVKFLQLQVKVLATDEFWPAAGGKAPEVAQVKEAIEAILSSHKDRNSSSK